MDSARKRAEEWLAGYDAVVKALPLGSVDTTEVRLLRALLAAEPAKVSGSVSIVRSDDPPAKPLPTCVNCGSNFIMPAPPAGAAVREAAEAVCERLCGGAGEAYYRKVAPGLVADIEALRAALRANASPAPGSDGVREAEAVLAEAREALDEIRRRSTDKLAGGIAASFLGAHPRAARRDGQKGGE
jgi:hypothetical protein